MGWRIAVLACVMCVHSAAADADAPLDGVTLTGHFGTSTALNGYDDYEQTRGTVFGARFGHAIPLGSDVWLEPGVYIHRVHPTTGQDWRMENTSTVMDVRLSAHWRRARLSARRGYGYTNLYIRRNTTESSSLFGTVIAGAGIDVLAFGRASIGVELFYENFEREYEVSVCCHRTGVVSIAATTSSHPRSRRLLDARCIQR